MNRYGKRCVLYPRVSTEMQVDGYSLEGQKNMLTRFADREEMIVVDTYEDAGKSGKSIEGRPAFQKMLRDIEDGLDIDYILVYKLSRFGRNAADILNSLELVQSYGVNLICIEEGIDSSQTSGKLLISVLSAVAEIERENIIEQTMNGRREKARQGGWNGGFAPYGYTLEDNKLMIEETEAVAIRKIFELYTSSEIGLGGIANQLNLQGIRKIPRQNGTLEDWTGHFIKLILDNPVYCGKIAYGRRTKEKVKGTKNDYQMKRNDDYILTEGQHKGIVSEEVWEKAHAKRLRTGVKQPSKIGRDRVHLLSGLLKCPVCGSPMYTNKHAWTNKDGTYKEIYYYVCSRNRMVRGKHCEYKAMLKKTDIEPMVIEAIREIVRNEEYAQAIKKRIGVQIDTKAVDKELEGYQAKLKEVDLNKTRLEREIDSLPADAKYRERKLHDMTLRLDSLYDVIVELEEKIEDAKLRRDAIKQQAITLENIYKIMVNFDCVYNIINDEEKRNVVTALIKEIEIYRNDESEYPLKRIGLNFPVFKDGGEVTELLWDKGNTVDGLVLLQDWVDALAALDEVRTVLRHYAGQRRGILRVGIAFLHEKILDMALADFLLQRNFVTGRAYIAEHETASLSYAVQTAPAARVTVVKPEDDFFQHTLFAIVRLAGQPDEIHQDAVQPGAVRAADIPEHLVADADDLLGRQAQYGAGPAVGSGVGLARLGNKKRADIAVESLNAHGRIVGKQQCFQPQAVDMAEQRVHLGRGIVAVVDKRVVNVKQNAFVAQRGQLFIVDGKYAGNMGRGVPTLKHAGPPYSRRRC